MTNYTYLSKYIVLFFALLALGGLSSCKQSEDSSEILISAAISLKEGLTECAREFEQEHPGTRITFNFGASGLLAQQIAQGAPVDVFVSASDQQVAALEKKGLLVADSIQKLAGNKLVVMAAADSRIKNMSDLKNVEKLAIGNPKTVPAGAYALKALKSAGLYEGLETAHKLVFAEDARQVLEYVEGANVDAGMVYITDARLASRGKVCFIIPSNLTGEMNYEVARVRRSQHAPLAEQFVNFLLGSQAKKMFEKLGFST